MVKVDTLIEGLDKMNISITDEEVEHFKIYKELLKEWNEKINITAITDDDEIDTKHFLDSLTPLSTKLFDKKVKVIDIGTGGGFPGIPLKLIKDDMELVLLDSLNKRIRFLDDVIKKLELENVQAFHGRAEDFGNDSKYREKFDIAISRAVASLDTLAEYCLPFVKLGGHFVAMKGPDIEDELGKANKAIKILGGEIIKKDFVTLPNSDIEHSLITIEKVQQTPKKYPRKAGTPERKPL